MPRFPANFIRIVKSKGMYCMLSSNLNVMKNVDEVLKAGPDWFRISLSGFTQEVYGRTHKHRQIERVKENMRLLAEAKKRVGARRTMILHAAGEGLRPRRRRRAIRPATAARSTRSTCTRRITRFRSCTRRTSDWSPRT